MSVTLSQQQIAAAIRAFENRLNSKKLECDALGKLRTTAPVLIGAILLKDENVPGLTGLWKSIAEDYLTAKINWLLIDIQEYELQIRALKSQQSGIVVPGAPVG